MENNRNLKKKIMTGALATSLLLGASACTNSKEKTPETVIVYETVVVTATPTPTNVPSNTPIPTDTPVPTPVPTNTPVPTEETTSTRETNEYGHDIGGLEYHLDNIYNRIVDINEKIDSIDFNEVKENTIQYAKDLIDFIFYGGEMNGMTFDELKEDAKQEIYEKLQSVDSFIMEYIPDYKERLGEKYNKVKDFASTTLEKAKEIFNSHIDIDINIEEQSIKKKSMKFTR